MTTPPPAGAVGEHATATHTSDPGHLPALVAEVDLAAGTVAIANPGVDGVVRGDVWLLVRLAGRAVGRVVVPLGEGLDELAVAAAVDRQLGAEVAVAAGRRVDPLELALGIPPAAAGEPELVGPAPSVTVVICTRDRPASLRKCLASIAAQSHGDAEVLVVDNAPTNGDTRAVVEAFASELRIRYALEPRPGVSFARNRAISLARTELLAWIDDDEVADPRWLAEVVAAFQAHPAAAAVSGLVLAAELETPAQIWFEQFGGLSKGRGFVHAVFRRGDMPQSHLYPLPPFGVGANMAFRRRALERIGGFDDALGAGTVTGGAEDTLVFTQLLELGETCVYHPDAITWHTHRRTMDGLQQQMKAYGTGLTAFYASLVLWRPSTVLRLVRLAPTAWRDMRDADSMRNAGVSSGPTDELLHANARQMLAGPWRYVRARVRARRLRSGAP